ncbi:hypothetical protein FOA43_004671 [Brettanomyces nanus]|uniref:J domain-containing protein n=1 Tax=Eeniella nana TaxID=13502 RepID=A0A875S8Q4_EENNA|nr:uncharacterized protein FOA43_004671 [Brettanomyces nanus]QPG77263.1 hypothetical protein FOA43_004671 [Brettanomyces nanus]
MAVPFPDIDPYEELGVSAKDSPPTVRKAYFKLCLKYHPDKLGKVTEKSKGEYKTRFERIQFSYAILGNIKRRKRYDDTGSLDDDDFLAEDFNWKDLFHRYNSIEVTEEMIEEDRNKYQDSKEEYEDIKESMTYYQGDFLKLFEVIPHLEFTQQEEERMFDMVKRMLKKKEIERYQNWGNYIENRTKEVKRMLRNVNKESLEADKMLQEIQKKAKQKAKLKEDSANISLQALIEAKHSKNNDPFEALLAKYSGANKGKGKKRKKTKDEYEIDDDEFERIQQEMIGKKKKV